MDDQIFKYSKLSILFVQIGIVFYSLMILLCAYVIETIIVLKKFEVLLFATCIIVSSLCIWMSLKWLKKKKRHIIINNEGIAEHYFNKGNVFIPWQKIEKVKYGRIYGGLVIVSGKNKVHIMNGIERFENIEKFLFKYADAYSKFRDKNIVLRYLEKLGIYI